MAEIMTYADDTDQTQEISQHIVISRDKSVYVPEIIRKSIVYRDHNVECLTFDCPRYWSGIDISELNIYVNYIAEGQKKKEEDPGSFLCENVVVDEDDTDIFHFDWIITSNASEFPDKLIFLVCAKSVDAEGNEDVHWNSRLCTSLEVQEGMEASDSIVKKYPDVIESILSKLGKQIELRNSGIAIQYRNAGENIWTDLVQLEDIRGDAAVIIESNFKGSDTTANIIAKTGETGDKWYSTDEGVYYMLSTSGEWINCGSGENLKKIEDEIGALKGDLSQLSEENKGLTGRVETLEKGGTTGGSTSIESFTSWLAIGDSITVGYSNSNYSYADILAEKYGIYLVKDAITGTHISTDSNFGTSFANRYSENADDYNLITVVGGINDWGHGVELGEFNPETTGTDTFANGMNTLVRGLIEKYPNSKIVFFTSNINNNTSANGITNLKFEDYVDVMRTVCAYYSIPFYPLHLLCGFNGLATYDLNADTMNSDKTHPLTAGHKKMADIIADCINFVNPVYSYGKGTLDVTLKTSNIPEGASTSEIKECLTVNVVYENGLSLELSDYTVEGSIVEGEESVLTIKYRNISTTFSVTGGESSGEYNLLFQLPEVVSVDSENKVVDLGYAPFTEASPRTIKAMFNVDSETTVGVSLFRAYVDNINSYCGIGINAVGVEKRMSIASSSSGSGALMASTTAGDYLVYPNDIELFIVWDGSSTVTAYVVDATGIKWSNTFDWVVTTGDGTLKFGHNHTSRYWTGTLSDLKVWGQAFTEQDVLNNI